MLWLDCVVVVGLKILETGIELELNYVREIGDNFCFVGDLVDEDCSVICNQKYSEEVMLPHLTHHSETDTDVRTMVFYFLEESFKLHHGNNIICIQKLGRSIHTQNQFCLAEKNYARCILCDNHIKIDVCA